MSRIFFLLTLTMLTAWHLAASSRTILTQEFNGPALSDVKSADGWMLQKFWGGKLSRGNGVLKLVATKTGNRNWGRIMCPLRRHNVSGMRLDLRFRVRGTGRFRAGAILYYPGRPAPQPKDYIWSGWETLTAEWRDFAMTPDLSGELLRGLNFALELDGDGQLELDAFRATGEYDGSVRIDAPAPILVRDGDPVPPPCFRTNRPGEKFIVFSASSADADAVPDVPAGMVTADAEGRAVISAAMIDASRPIQVFRLSLLGNGLLRAPASGGCGLCSVVMSEDRTTGTVVATRIPGAAYDSALTAARRMKRDIPRNILILADSLWDFDRGSGTADQLAYFLKAGTGKDFSVRNYAVHGDRSERMLKRLTGKLDLVTHGPARYRELEKEAPGLILIMLGHNDTAADSRNGFAVPAVSPEDGYRDYMEIIRFLRKRWPSAKIVLLTPTASDRETIVRRCGERLRAGAKVVFRYGDPDKAAAFIAMLRKVAAEEDLPVWDMYRPTEKLPEKSSYFRPDGVHLSLRGYSLLTRIILEEMGKCAAF